MEGSVGAGTNSDVAILLLVGLPFDFDFSVDDLEEALSLSGYNERFPDNRLHQQSFLVIGLVSPKSLCITKNRGRHCTPNLGPQTLPRLPSEVRRQPKHW